MNRGICSILKLVKLSPTDARTGITVKIVNRIMNGAIKR